MLLGNNLGSNEDGKQECHNGRCKCEQTSQEGGGSCPAVGQRGLETVPYSGDDSSIRGRHGESSVSAGPSSHSSIRGTNAGTAGLGHPKDTATECGLSRREAGCKVPRNEDDYKLRPIYVRQELKNGTDTSTDENKEFQLQVYVPRGRPHRPEEPSTASQPRREFHTSDACPDFWRKNRPAGAQAYGTVADSICRRSTASCFIDQQTQDAADAGKVPVGGFVSRPTAQSDGGSIQGELGTHPSQGMLALKFAEKGIIKRATTAVARGAPEAFFPLHLKEVGRVDWVKITQWIRTEHQELLEKYEKHLLWFTSEEFLAERTKEFKTRFPAAVDDRIPTEAWATLEDYDIEELLIKLRIREVSRDEILAWCIVFAVLELGKQRRRVITAPQLNELSSGVETFDDIPVSKVETARLAVLVEAAFTMDFPWFFGQMPPAEKCQVFYGFAHKSSSGRVRYFVVTSVPTGSRYVPLIAQTISTALARSASSGNTELIDVCLDNNRIAGNVMSVLRAEQNFDALCQYLSLTTNTPTGTTSAHYEFLGVVYDHVTESVSLGEKLLNKIALQHTFLQQTKVWTIRDALSAMGLLVYASRVLAIRTAKFYHFYACLRRRVRKCDLENDNLESPARLWNAARLQLNAWFSEVLAAPSAQVKLYAAPHAVVFTDASETGWGAVLFEDAEISTTTEAVEATEYNLLRDHTMSVRGGRFSQTELICVLEARAALYGIHMFVQKHPAVGVMAASCICW
jgi:hypothetical protein